MYILMERNKSIDDKNYKSYEKEEFISLVKSIGEKLRVLNIPEIIFFDEDAPVGYCKGIFNENNYVPGTRI